MDTFIPKYPGQSPPSGFAMFCFGLSSKMIERAEAILPPVLEDSIDEEKIDKVEVGQTI